MTYEIALEFALTLLLYVGSITFALFFINNNSLCAKFFTS